MTMISYDRQGRIWKQWEGGSDYYERKPVMKWFEGTPDHFVSWSHVHAHDLQSNRMSRFALRSEISSTNSAIDWTSARSARRWIADS